MPNKFVWPTSPPIMRNCLVYKADGSANGPLVVPMVFNIEGTDSNEAASLVREIAPDLRATYGPSTKEHIQLRVLGGGRDARHPHLDNQWAVFWTRDSAYPKNRTLCRMLGVDPDVPSARPMWRGDVVVAFAQDDHSISERNLSMMQSSPPVNQSLFWKPSFHWKDVQGVPAMLIADVIDGVVGS